MCALLHERRPVGWHAAWEIGRSVRQAPGWAQYGTPIGNLYLCGAGTHLVGGVTGALGFSAAREILKDVKRKAN